jgi:hypothetical protein
MDITIRVQTEVAFELQNHQSNTNATQELLKTLAELEVTLEPMHPGADSPSLAPYFTVAVPNAEAAEQVLDRLQACEAVEGAYIKPPDAMP